MTSHTFDYHTHTTASDGALTPQALFDIANKAGVKRLAITDHDTVEGYHQLSQVVLTTDCQLISGAEWTCLHDKQVVHIVGLGFDAKHVSITDHVHKLESLRIKRAENIAFRLEKHFGVSGLLDDAYAVCTGQLGRPHFAKVLVDRDLVADTGQAFKRYLGAGKLGDVKVLWPSISDVIELVKQAGGVTILAHPTKYRLTLTKIRVLVAAFAAAGGDALEIAYPGITLDQQRSLGFLVDKHRLYVSGGSDFHTPDNRWSAVGAFPSIPDNFSLIDEHELIF